MSTLILINGLLNIITCIMFLFYGNKYRSIIKPSKIRIYVLISVYLLFVGFLRIRMAMQVNEWNEILEYSTEGISTLIGTTISLILIAFLTDNILFKGTINKTKI